MKKTVIEKLIVIRKRLRNRQAFTLAEALVAIIILLLVTSIVAAGIPAAMRAYEKTVLASNAEVLLSTTMTTLRNELDTAKDVKAAADGSEISFFNSSMGSISTISKSSGNPSDIMYQRCSADGVVLTDEEIEKMPDAVKVNYRPVKLMSDAVSDKKNQLHVTYTKVNYDEKKGVVTFTGLKVTKDNGDDTPAKREGTFSVRVFSSDKKTDS